MKNSKGSVLLASLVAIIVLVILLALVYSISASYYQRTVDFEAKNQAYYTAKSTVDTLSDQIGKGLRSSDNTEFLGLLKSQPNKILTFDFPVNDSLAESCSVTAVHDSINGTIDLTATAVKGGESYTISLHIREQIDFTDTKYEEIIMPIAKSSGVGRLCFFDAKDHSNQRYFSVADKDYIDFSNITFTNAYQKNVPGGPRVGDPMMLFIFIGNGITLQLNNRTTGNNIMATDAPIYFILSDNATLDFAGWATPKPGQDIYVYGPATAKVINTGSTVVTVVDLSAAIGLVDNRLTEGYYPKDLLGARINTKPYVGSPYPLYDFKADLIYSIVEESGIAVEYGPVRYRLVTSD